MKSAPSAGVARTADRCPSCRAPMELVTPRLGTDYRRCTSCGRDDRPSADNHQGENGSRGAGKCRLVGCPGTLGGDGKCPCCAKRDAFIAANMPKRHCKICGGVLEGRGWVRYCAACKPVAAKVQTAKWQKAK
jgi:hypothetical protein